MLYLKCSGREQAPGRGYHRPSHRGVYSSARFVPEPESCTPRFSTQFILIMRLHLPKGLLAALLAACFASTVPLAEGGAVFIGSDGTATGITLSSGERLLFDGTGTSPSAIRYDKEIKVSGGDHWCGPGDSTQTGTNDGAKESTYSHYIELSGIISDYIPSGESTYSGGTLKFNAYSTAGDKANAVWELSGANTYTGNFEINHGGGANSYAQLTLSGTFSGSNLVTLANNKTILHIANNVTLAGLVGASEGRSVTAVAGATLTLNVTGTTPRTYSGTLGTGRYLTDAAYSATDLSTTSTSGEASAAVNLTKTGTGTQNLNGTNKFGTLNVEQGTLGLGGTTTLTGTTTVSSGATLSNTGTLANADTITVSSGATLSNTGTLKNEGNMSISGAYTGSMILQADGASLILKDGAVVNLDGLEQQKFCSATETASQSYYTQYVLSTHDIGSIEDDATVRFNLSGQVVGGTFDKGVYTLSAAAGTCYHIASGDTVSYSSLASAETGDFINVVGTLTADAAITKSVNLAGGTLVGAGYNVTGDVSVTKDSTLKLNGDMSLTGAISSVSGHTLFVSLDQNVTSGVLTISGSEVGKLNHGTLKIEDGATVAVTGHSSGNAQIAGAIVVNAGGTLELTGDDTLGYSTNNGNYTDSITLTGTGGKAANLTLTNYQTLSTDLVLNGHTSVSGSAVNSFGGSITVSGTNNVFSTELKVRENITINVKTSGDSLEFNGVLSNYNEGSGGIIKTGEGKLIISGNANTGTRSMTVNAGTLELRSTYNAQMLDLRGADGSFGSAVITAGGSAKLSTSGDYGLRMYQGSSLSLLAAEGEKAGGALSIGDLITIQAAGNNASIKSTATSGKSNYTFIGDGYEFIDADVKIHGDCSGTYGAKLTNVALINDSTGNATVTVGNAANTLRGVEAKGGNIKFAADAEVTGYIKIADGKSVVVNSGAALTHDGFTYDGSTIKTTSAADALSLFIDLAKKHNCAIITAHGTDTAKTRPQTPID